MQLENHILSKQMIFTQGMGRNELELQEIA